MKLLRPLQDEALHIVTLGVKEYSAPAADVVFCTGATEHVDKHEPRRSRIPDPR